MVFVHDASDLSRFGQDKSQRCDLNSLQIEMVDKIQTFIANFISEPSSISQVTRARARSDNADVDAMWPSDAVFAFPCGALWSSRPQYRGQVLLERTM